MSLVNLGLIHLVWLDVVDRDPIDGNRSYSTTAVKLRRDPTHGIMSRLFFTLGVCARSYLATFCVSRSLTPQGSGSRVNQLLSAKRTDFTRQQRRYIGRSNAVFAKLPSKSGIWICGVGVGIALAVGLKYRTDAASNYCDDNIRSAQRTDRYSDAIKVSRDLVERIKVSAEDRGEVSFRLDTRPPSAFESVLLETISLQRPSNLS